MGSPAMAEGICFKEWKKEVAAMILEREHRQEAQLQGMMSELKTLILKLSHQSIEMGESCSGSKFNGEKDGVAVTISDVGLEENETSSSGKNVENSDEDDDYVEEAPEGSSGFEAVSSESKGNLDDFDIDGEYCDGVFDRETFGIEEVDNKEHVQDFCGGQPTRKRIRAYEDHEVEKILANSMWGKTGMPSEEINEPIIEPSLSFIAAGKTISYKVLTIAAGVRTLKLQEFDVNESNAENDCYLQDLPVAIACKRGCWNLKENEYEMRQRQRKKIGFLSTKKLRVGICQ